MKLTDKIQNAYSNKLSDYSKIYTPTAEVIEGIADEFAIDFLKWCESKSVFSPSVIHKPTYEKLLKAYKEEMNL